MKIATMVEINGEFRTREEWCVVYGLTSSAVGRRMERSGMTLVEAITTPRKGCRKKRAAEALAKKPGCPVDSRDIPGYPNYAATCDGRIWNKRKKSMLSTSVPSSPDAAQYLRVTLNGDSLYVHRLICIAWHEKLDGNLDVVDHIDRDTFNNSPDNLRWTDMKGNADNRKDTVFIEHNGKIERLQDVLISYGLVSNSAAYRRAFIRITSGASCTIEEAIEPEKIDRRCNIIFDGRTMSQAEWCRELGISEHGIRWRERHKGETKEQALSHFQKKNLFCQGC